MRVPIAAVLVAGAGLVLAQACLPRAAPSVIARPFTAPGPLTDPAAQVAWTASGAGATGVTPDGRVLGHITGTFALYLTYRSPDLKTLVAIDGAEVRVYEAGTGALRSTIPRPASGVTQDAFSPDGRYLALLTGEAPPRVQLLDLEQGALAGTLTLPNPGGRGPGFIVFHPDLGFPALFVLTDTWNSPRVTVLSWHRGQLAVTQSFVPGLPACSDPAPYVAHLLADGQTMALFCHVDGRIALLPAFGGSRPVRVIETHQPNPFWFWPVFSPDGQYVYLHDQFHETVTRVDLETRKVGPAATPSAAPGFAERVAGLFVTDAEAGGIGSTAPISPDGSLLYLPQPTGLLVVDTSTMLAAYRLLPRHDVHEVWVSGDGLHLFALVDGGGLLLVDAKGGTAAAAAAGERFLAADHG